MTAAKAQFNNYFFILTDYYNNYYDNNDNNDSTASMTTTTTIVTAAGRRSRNPTATSQLLDSWAWLDGVSNTHSPLGYDDFAQWVVDPPLFPPTAPSGASPVDSFSFSPSQSQSLLSLSPSSSTTLDADSLQSFNTTTATAQGAQGAMSDAEFQLLLNGLSQADMAVMTLPLPCEPFVPVVPLPAADQFALHAFPSLDMFSPMDVQLPPVSVPAPTPAPLPVTVSPAPEQTVRCRTCHRAYPTPCRLRKHEHTHTRPFSCTVCHKGHAAKKDLHRHLWTTHPEAAADLGIPSPMRVCPVAGCGFESRQDNLTRHIRTKHAGEYA